MSFRDYSNDPNANTTIGEAIYIGPDMARNDVRPALQQIAADGKELYDVLLDAGDPVPSGLARAASRTALAAITGQAAGMARYLSESGREGLFVFDSSDLSAKVTADPNQGVYVAPAAASTGASGAWVRRVDGAHNVKWFGATGNGTTNDAPAIQAALNYLRATGTALTGWGTGRGSPELFFPAGDYNCSTTTLDIYSTMRLRGESVGDTGVGAAQLKWSAGTTGIRVQRHNTTGDSGSVASSTYPGGDATIIEGLWLKGGYTTTEGEYHGIYLRARATIRDCVIYGFQGDGIRVAAGSDGSPVLGNANLFRIERVNCSICRNGLYVAGTDANAGTVIAFCANSCRAWGIYDQSFLGNSYYGPHVAGNGNTSENGVNVPASVVHSSGHRYAVKVGQETGASTNAPSGTTADNTWWYYFMDGGSYVGCPDWVSGISLRAGGAFCTNSFGTTEFYSSYSEAGEGPSQFSYPTMVFGGQNGAGIKGSGAYVKNDGGSFSTEKLAVSNSFTISGSIFNLGDSASAFTQNYDVGTTSTIMFRSNTGGFQRDGSLNVNRTSGVSLNGTTALALGLGNAYAGATDMLKFSSGVSEFLNGKFGYGTGSGGTITQITSKATGVTLNKACGQITLNGAALAAATIVSFTLTNSTIAAGDVLVLNHISGGTGGAYTLNAQSGAGTATINVRNNTAGSLSEAIVIAFAVIKAVTT